MSSVQSRRAIRWSEISDQIQLFNIDAFFQILKVAKIVSRVQTALGPSFSMNFAMDISTARKKHYDILFYYFGKNQTGTLSSFYFRIVNIDIWKIGSIDADKVNDHGNATMIGKKFTYHAILPAA